MTIFGKEIALRVIVLVLIALMLVLAVGFGLNECSARRSADKQAEVSQGQAGASIGAGAEAGNTFSSVTANNSGTDAAVQQGQGEVRSAPEAAKGNATVKAACRFKANRNKPECQPKGPAR